MFHLINIILRSTCLNAPSSPGRFLISVDSFHLFQFTTQKGINYMITFIYTLIDTCQISVVHGSRHSSDGVKDMVIVTRTHQESVNCLMTLTTMYFFKACCTDRTMFSSTCSKIVNQHNTPCVLDHTLKNSFRKHLI